MNKENFLNFKDNDNEIKIYDYNEIYIYGYLGAGKILKTFLEKRKIKTLLFIDKRAEKEDIYYGDDHLTFDFDKLDKNIPVIVSNITTVDMSELKLFLENKGFTVYIAEESIMHFFFLYEEMVSFEEINKFFYTNFEKIEKARDLFENEEKKNFDIVVNYLSGQSDQFLKYDHTNIYCTDNEFSYDTYIDCGGYLGDTVEFLLSKGKAIKNLYIFEPNTENFNSMINYLKTTDIENIHPYNYGVSDVNESFNFSFATSASHVDASGSETISCVKLDDVVLTDNPTFIKMDIEGSEISAIKGAENLIKKYSPTLAISIYHMLSDFYEIPLLIHSINSKYKFKIVNHGKFKNIYLETVLYAYIDDLETEKN